MHTSTRTPLAAAFVACVLTACAPASMPSATAAPPAAQATAMAGWYIQQGGRATLRPCGDATALQVENGLELAARARDFGLQDGDPVYVKVQGARIGVALRLERVDQFGSATPIRDCPMGGTSIQG